MSESTLTGKKALVAGGASGIGAAAVRALAQRGAHVIVADIDPAGFHRILTLMLESPFLLIRAVLPHMYEREWGRIINVSSVHGLPASAFKSAYVAAKHGVEGLSKAVALEGDQQLREPQLRADSAGRQTNQGPGRNARDPRRGSGQEDHAHRRRLHDGRRLDGVLIGVMRSAVNDLPVPG